MLNPQSTNYRRDGYRSVGTYSTRSRYDYSSIPGHPPGAYFSPKSSQRYDQTKLAVMPVLFWTSLIVLFLTCFPTSALASDPGHFELICANGAVAQTRSDGTLEVVDETKLHLEKERAKALLASSKKSPGSVEEHVSRWQYDHLQRKIRATQKQKNLCNDVKR